MSDMFNKLRDGHAHFLQFRTTRNGNSEDLYMIAEDGYLRLVYEIPTTNNTSDWSKYIDDWKKSVIIELDTNDNTFRMAHSSEATEYFPLSGPNKKPYRMASAEAIGKSGSYYGYPCGSEVFHITGDGVIMDAANNPVTIHRTNTHTYIGHGTDEIPRLVDVRPNSASNNIQGDQDKRRMQPAPQLNATDLAMIQGIVTNFAASLQTCDMNRDGNIDRNELTQVLLRANTPYDAAMDTTNKIFQILDKDNNGVLNYNDIMLYQQNPLQQPQQQPYNPYNPQPQQPTYPQQQPYNPYQQPQQPAYPQQQPYNPYQQQQGFGGGVQASELQAYNGLTFLGMAIFKRGTMEEYYVMYNGAFKQINWLRDNVGGGQWVKAGW